jgi:hypothetical protein
MYLAAQPGVISVTAPPEEHSTTTTIDDQEVQAEEDDVQEDKTGTTEVAEDEEKVEQHEPGDYEEHKTVQLERTECGIHQRMQSMSLATSYS